MAQLLVRNLDEDVKKRLQQRAAAHGRSMEEEARQILREATLGRSKREKGLGSTIAARFKGVGVKERELQPLPTEEPRIPQIAGIATARRATLATRNVKQFDDLDVPVVDPWA